jgi:L-ascorbate metabolism protein UlaG (beta-lactamase superfamily)
MKTRYLAIILLVLTGLTLGACQTKPEGEVTIYYEENAQFELIGPQGERVLIDVYDPSLLSAPASENDILLTTHGHQDHFNPGFIADFPGEQLFIRSGELSTGDVSITGIASAHTAFDSETYPEEGGSNYIYVIEIGGMRIAHLGDIGQEELTAEQLEALGEVDIALTQFVNSYSQMDMTNLKGFNLMEQLKPKLIIPTHGNGNMDAMGHAGELWQAYANPPREITIRQSDFGEGTQFVIVGAGANSMQAIFNLPFWGAK